MRRPAGIVAPGPHHAGRLRAFPFCSIRLRPKALGQKVIPTAKVTMETQNPPEPRKPQRSDSDSKMTRKQLK
eukprot:983778-Amphidinium_carterae.1